MSVGTGSPVWADGQRRLVLGKLIKSGGAGSVYHLPGSPLQVAKIYHDSTDLAECERKVAAMLELSPQLTDLVENGRRYVQIAWPQSLLRDERGRFVGFAMPAVDVQATSELECILQERQARAAGLPTGLGAKITLAANLAAVIAELHKQGHYVIDLKPVNLRFYPHSLYMAMLDCDGFSIDGKGERFAAEQITPDYLAPEFQGRPIAASEEEQQDRFALAVVIFQLLNFGIHPFTGRPTSDRVPTDIPGRIAHRCYAYGTRANPDMRPSPVSGHRVMPTDLRLLFDRAFEGAGSTRPKAGEWTDALKVYAQRSSQRLAVCDKDKDHQHFAGMACAACARSALITATQAAAGSRPQLRAGASIATGAIPTARGTRAPHTLQSAQSVVPAGSGMPFGAWLPPSAGLPPRSTPTRIGSRHMSVGYIVFFWLPVAIVFTALMASRLGHAISGATPVPAVYTPLPAPSSAPADVPRSAAPMVDPHKPRWSVELATARRQVQAVASAVRAADQTAAASAMAQLRQTASTLPTSHPAASGPGFEHFSVGVSTRLDLDRQAVRQSLETTLAQYPHDEDTLCKLGLLALLDHDRAGAANWFLEAIASDPVEATGWYGLGVAQIDDSEAAAGAILVAEDLSPAAAGDRPLQAAFSPMLLDRAGIDPDKVARTVTLAREQSAAGNVLSARL